ncbi:AMP-binding protein, partial [Janthinobacterium sp. SUN211]|uniref:thioesterase domain-containing protein n=1 Tax=Janthinobacterium sp. SUN211 TaxID=3014786 RepID=UPI0027133876
ITPSYLNVLALGKRHSLPHLRLLIAGGEAMSMELAGRWDSDCVLMNAYGPTEATVTATTFRLHDLPSNGSGSLRYIPIGRSTGDTQIYVLDTRLQPVPPGVIGEIYIGGASVARGYLNLPALTAERFLQDPFRSKQGSLLYKTGDLGRWLVCGNVEFLGRNDHQVKIRGFRIELGEVENALRTHEDVKDAVVIAREAPEGGKRLLAYVVSNGAALEQTLDVRNQLTAQLRQHLMCNLPDYMVPQAVMVLDQFPLTLNGKIDQKALPEYDQAALEREYVEARTAVERALCESWQEVLRIPRVGITDNFFQLGGHSLLAIQLMSTVRRRLDVEMPLRSLFIAPDPESFARAIANQATVIPFQNLVRIRSGSTAITSPLFLLHSGEGEIAYAIKLAQSLHGDLPVYGLAAIGFLDGEEVMSSVSTMASMQMKAIRHIQPEGPYRLAGWSAGGTIAYEIARQLLDDGEEVDFLGLIDTTSNYGGGSLSTGYVDVDDAAFWLANLGELPKGVATQLQALASCGDLALMFDVCRREDLIPPQLDFAAFRRHLAVRASIARALYAYKLVPIPINISLFCAVDEMRSEPDLGWKQVMGGRVSITSIGGGHYTIMDEPNIKALGEAISAKLRL